MKQERGNKLPKKDDHTLIDMSQLFMICFIHFQEFLFRSPRQKVNVIEVACRSVGLQTLHA